MLPLLRKTETKPSANNFVGVKQTEISKDDQIHNKMKRDEKKSSLKLRGKKNESRRATTEAKKPKVNKQAFPLCG